MKEEVSFFIAVQQQWGEEIFPCTRRKRARREEDRAIDGEAETRRREKDGRTGEARIDPIKYSRS